MFNTTQVLDTLVTALREGGEAKVREIAKQEAARLGQVNEVALAAIIDEVVAALASFDRAAALAVIEGAEARLNEPEEESADEEDADEVAPANTTSTTDHEARLQALEQIAREQGWSDYVVSGATFEVRLTNLERLASRHGLR